MLTDALDVRGWLGLKYQMLTDPYGGYGWVGWKYKKYFRKLTEGVGEWVWKYLMFT